jgi:hypothetical protein
MMPIYRKKINGRKVYWVRVNYQRLHASRVCESREAAKDAEAELRDRLRKKVEQAEQAGQQPATLKALFEAYVEDLVNRGKSDETVKRAAQTARVVEARMPDFLAKPVARITAVDLFAFREVRIRGGTKPSTINRDLITLRAMLKRARPDFTFPPGAF